MNFDFSIDAPVDNVIRTPYLTVRGWIETPSDASSDSPMAEIFSARIGNAPCRVQGDFRPGLGPNRAGFIIYVDLTAVRFGELEDGLEVIFDRTDGKTATHRFDVSLIPHHKQAILEIPQMKSNKRNWLLQHLASPGGRAPLAEVTDTLIKFEDGQFFDQSHTDAIQLIPESFGFSGVLEEKTDRVSAHAYSALLQRELSKESSHLEEFMALDFGAGLRLTDRPNIINMEIFDYPSTDVLCVGQQLPFQSNCFDMVCTFAVLEHVDDPFSCAKEILRVLKPGGRLISGVPFLQPEHGYPSHYYNMTREGHRHLYGEGLDDVEQFVDDHQHPITSLQWILRAYANGLRPDAKDAMLKMSIGDFMRMPYHNDKNNAVFKMDEEALFRVASATTLTGRKRQR